MVGRRQFIQSGVAASVLFSLPAGSPAGELDRLALDHFVFDGRFDGARQLARQFASAGARVSNVAAGLMELWYHQLDLQWKALPTPLAGATTRESLFVLETFAADHRMRVIYRGKHGTPRNGVARHRMSGPAAVIGPMQRLSRRPPWSTLASAMAQCPARPSSRETYEATTTSDATTKRDEALYTWIIAPRVLSA
jgi:hypothetical protein